MTGFRAHVYHNETTKEVVIAFAGTHMTDVGDLSADVAIYNGQLPRQFYDALDLYKEVVRLHGGRTISKRKSPSRDTPSAARWPSTWPSPPRAAPP